MIMHGRTPRFAPLLALPLLAQAAAAQTGPLIAHSEQGRTHVLSFVDGDGMPRTFSIDSDFENSIPSTDGGNCVADMDDGSYTGTPDDGVTVDDLLYYLFAFEMGFASADVDGGNFDGIPDGGLTIDDLLYYLERFESGC